MSRKTIYWIIGLAVVAGLVWYFFLKKKANQQQPSGAAATGGGGTIVIPAFQTATVVTPATVDTPGRIRIVNPATLGKKITKENPIDAARSSGFQIRPGSGSMSADSMGNLASIRAMRFRS